MVQGKVLVTGATGDTGRATVDGLLAHGHPVRALAHGNDDRSRSLQERGVEVVFADLLDFHQVRAALNGVQRAYFIYPIRPGIVQATAQFAEAAKEVGVDGIVNMSQKAARDDAKSNASFFHWLAERVFDWSGLNVVHISPTYFAEWLLYVAPMIRKGLLHVPFGTGRHAPISADDMGRVIVAILEDPAAHRGKVYPLFGPVEYSYQEIAEVLSRVLGKNVEYMQVGFEEFKQALQEAAQTSAKSQSSRTFFAKSERTPEQRAGDDFLFQHLRNSRSIIRTGFSPARTIWSRRPADARRRRLRVSSRNTARPSSDEPSARVSFPPNGHPRRRHMMTRPETHLRAPMIGVPSSQRIAVVSAAAVSALLNESRRAGARSLTTPTPHADPVLSKAE